MRQELIGMPTPNKGVDWRFSAVSCRLLISGSQVRFLIPTLTSLMRGPGIDVLSASEMRISFKTLRNDI